MIEWTIESSKHYADPFNEVEVDCIFSREGQSWRVPAFWRGGQQWTVRFAPPSEGEYGYRLQSTDPTNPDLNGHPGAVSIATYRGPNDLLRRGMLRVSASRRHFEHADGTPFYWLGDTWWTGLSDRLSWDGFQKLAADRKAKGFTIVQLVAGLVPFEERAPVDPGFRNEGGPVWEPHFERINPEFFDYADRRIFHLLDEGIVPVVLGGWNTVLREMGVAKMKQHWRYIIARYGAYPTFWVVGGEIIDPPQEVAARIPESLQPWIVCGWTEITKFIRDVDPYRHPLSVHEAPPPFDRAIQDESLTDFDMFQSSHFGWPSIALEVAQLNTHYARTCVTKPIVQGEIGYEKLGESHFEDFQRTAFWLSMLNGAAGHTYGANGTWEAYTGDKPLHRCRHSFVSWAEGMNLPGSYQLGIAANLLRQYQWWRFEPHPEWITPSGTTLLEPCERIEAADLGTFDPWILSSIGEPSESWEGNYPGGEWKARQGNFRRPYAAGIPGEVRFIYIPRFGLFQASTPPTVLGLEVDVRYCAYLWEPSFGIRLNLGAVQRPAPGATVVQESIAEMRSSVWSTNGKAPSGMAFKILSNSCETNCIVSMEASSSSQVRLVLRYQNDGHYLAAVFSPEEGALFLLDRQNRDDGRPLGRTRVSAVSTQIRLTAEVRDDKAVCALTDGDRTYTTPIVDVKNVAAGSVGLLRKNESACSDFGSFELRQSPSLVRDAFLQRDLYDARGSHRGNLAGKELTDGPLKIPAWDDFGRDKHILLDAYRLQRLPTTGGDWILVLEAAHAATRP